MAESSSNTTPSSLQNPQDFFLGTDLAEQKNIKRKQFFQEVWQKIQYYWSLVWPYIYNFFSFIIYEVVKVTKGIIHIAVSQINQKD